MKHLISNICTMAALLIAGAAFTACSSDDDILNNDDSIVPLPTIGKRVYTLTISTASATTRALTLDGTTLTPSWAVDEVLTVKKGLTEVGSLVVTAVDNDGNATFTGQITGDFAANDELKLVYHPVADGYNGQDGKLSTIASTYDQAIATVTIGEVNNETNTITITNGDNVEFTSQQAIVKFTLKDENGQPIHPSSVTVKMIATHVKTSETSFYLQVNLPVKTFNFAVASDAYTENGGDLLFFALPELPAKLKTKVGYFKEAFLDTDHSKLKIEAFCANDVYTNEAKKYTIKNGKYYTSTISMTKQVVEEPATIDLSTLTNGGSFTSYTIQDGYVVTGTLGAKVKIQIADGASVTLRNVTIEGTNDAKWAGINCLGDATITLQGTNTVKGFHEDYPGIQVPGEKDNPANNKTLTIKGDGLLNASSNGRAPGLGSANIYNQRNCGNITISGGTVIATGGENSAGIGCCYDSYCGTITISGGTVIATGGYGAAGIGCGRFESSFDKIIISGGTVTANGGQNGAGIGGGGQSTAGTIEIKGGTVTAKGGEGGAGIGCSDNGSACGDIIISDGEIIAEGGDYATGIGSGSTQMGSSTCGNITISGGTVTATGDVGAAGIGSGLYDSVCGNITVSGGTVEVTGGYGGAGIGSGYLGSVCSDISINKGNIEATGGYGGAGIGSGFGFSICGNISINGGTIVATGDTGIGGGAISDCGDITITNNVTRVTATRADDSPHSIGRGYVSKEYSTPTCGTVTIGGTVYWQNNAYVGTGATYLTQSPLIYPAQ